MRARQVEENGVATARPSLPAQRQVTKRIMKDWLLHQQLLQNPRPAVRDVHLLHLAQYQEKTCEVITPYGVITQFPKNGRLFTPKYRFITPLTFEFVQFRCE